MEGVVSSGDAVAELVREIGQLVARLPRVIDERYCNEANTTLDRLPQHCLISYNRFHTRSAANSA